MEGQGVRRRHLQHRIAKFRHPGKLTEGFRGLPPRKGLQGLQAFVQIEIFVVNNQQNG